MAQPTNIVVVGPGLIGKKHIAVIQTSAECRLSAIVAPDHEHNSRYCRDLGVEMYTRLDEVLERRPDGVIIASPNQFHAPQALQCIEAGVPVLVEKPITGEVDSGRMLCEASRRSGVAVLVGHHRYHNPIMKVAVDAILSGALGDIVTVDGSTTFYKPASYFREGPWRSIDGGGPILINLIHDIGCLRYLCGEIEAVHAFASSRIRQFAVEDSVSINMRFESGALGSFVLSDTAVSSNSWEHTSAENPNFPHDPLQDCYRISGTTGTLHLPSLRLSRYEGEKSWLQPLSQRTLPVTQRDPFACQIEHFVRVIRGEQAPIVSANEGMKNLRVTEAIRQSSQTGRAVKI